MNFKQPARRIFLGIDPGSAGGVAALDCIRIGTGIDVKALGGLTLFQTWEWFKSYQHSPEQYVFATMELVGGFIPRNNNSIGGQPGSRMFTFGKSVGHLEAFLIAANIPHEFIVPRRWQDHFGLKRDKSDSDSKWKNRLKSKTMELFPDLRVTLATADALLIAQYCKDTRG